MNRSIRIDAIELRLRGASRHQAGELVVAMQRELARGLQQILTGHGEAENAVRIPKLQVPTVKIASHATSAVSGRAIAGPICQTIAAAARGEPGKGER